LISLVSLVLLQFIGVTNPIGAVKIAAIQGYIISFF
jgi:hypothetical protein